MKRIVAMLLVMIVGVNNRSNAQFSRYIIKLTDKAGSPFAAANPSQFLSQKAIDRRARFGIAVNESDLPVNPAYIDSIRLAGNVTILNSSKWLNQVCIKTTDAIALAKINAMPFVNSSSPVAPRAGKRAQLVNKQLTQPAVPASFTSAYAARPLQPNGQYNYGLAYPQVHLNNTDFLHNHGFRGEGMLMAVMDAGFNNYLSLPTFDSVRNNNQILGTWDFVANKESVNEEDAHGMHCFSAIAANLPGSFVGTAPKTSFYLYRTEDVSSEYPVEEQNFAAAAEKADSLGVDIFSVSLGYNTFDNSSFNYTYADMNGHTTLISQAVNMASQKGIMVVAAAGNAGNSSWRYVTTPGDAAEALSVGAVNAGRQAGNFSSYGPNSNGQIKPDVAAVGTNAVIANAGSGQPMFGNGTSYATPIMAGVATCLWQAFPEVSNSGIMDVLRKAGDRSNTPDDRTGYGIPDAKKAFVLLIKKGYTQQVVVGENCVANLAWSVKTASDMDFVVERKLPSDNNYIAVDTQSINSSFSRQGFSFSDDLAAVGTGITIQYRIKMNIGTDTSFYLDSAMLQNTLSCRNNNIVIAPNPVTDHLTVGLEKFEQVKVSITVHASNGQQVYQLINQSVNGVQTFTIPMKQLSRGVYYVTVWVDNKKMLVKKVVRE